jgi:hypothetical protein
MYAVDNFKSTYKYTHESGGLKDSKYRKRIGSGVEATTH